jgi:hypothetical protein
MKHACLLRTAIGSMSVAAMLAASHAALFPSLEQQGRSAEIITKQWDTVVGANIQ